ncbi:MAG: NAD+ synthase [Phycisphaeraceae bacterium]
MKIALAQINPTVGDIDGNAALIRRSLHQAVERGARLVVFPELAIIGYPPKDLLLKPAVIRECVQAVQDLASECHDVAAIIGYPCPSDSPRGLALYNAAALCVDGQIAHRHVKSLLPTYDVFDEHRYFEPGPPVDIARLDGLKLGISICEDLWNDERIFSRQLYHDNPIDQLVQRGAGLFVNCAASPFVVRKYPFRQKLMTHAARAHHLPLVYCNQVGGNDELVFDGYSCAIDAQGNVIAEAKGFEEELLVVDLSLGDEAQKAGIGARGSELGQTSPESPPSGRDASITDESTPIPETRYPSPDPLAAAYHALVLGLRDYCRKCGFKSVVLGLSGGIDSAVAAAICVAALGSKHVRGIAMPSRYSSPGSKDDAKALADRLGITFQGIPIEAPHAAFEQLLEPSFHGLPPDSTEENIQARVRGIILMAFSNKFGEMLVTTGNKSEVAVGYCTLYGDMAGGLAILSDVPKTMVYQLARWINDAPASPLRERFEGPVIPENTITKPPSAELRPDQTDQDTLPEYDVLDNIIERYVEREQSARRIVSETGYDADVVLKVIRLIDVNEYKRKQMAPGIKITGRAFGFGRRMPIAQRYDSRRSLEAAQAVAAAHDRD